MCQMSSQSGFSTGVRATRWFRTGSRSKSIKSAFPDSWDTTNSTGPLCWSGWLCPEMQRPHCCRQLSWTSVVFWQRLIKYLQATSAHLLKQDLFEMWPWIQRTKADTFVATTVWFPGVEQPEEISAMTPTTSSYRSTENYTLTWSFGSHYHSPGVGLCSLQNKRPHWRCERKTNRLVSLGKTNLVLLWLALEKTRYHQAYYT